jgi:hypothetical protein
VVEILVIHPRLHLVHDGSLWIKLRVPRGRVDDENIIVRMVTFVWDNIDRIVLELGKKHAGSVHFGEFLCRAPPSVKLDANSRPRRKFTIHCLLCLLDLSVDV